MPANHPNDTPFPVRGVPGGWRDWWETNEAAEVQAHVVAHDKALHLQVQIEGLRWRAELSGECKKDLAGTCDELFRALGWRA